MFGKIHKEEFEHNFRAEVTASVDEAKHIFHAVEDGLEPVKFDQLRNGEFYISARSLSRFVQYITEDSDESARVFVVVCVAKRDTDAEHCCLFDVIHN